MSEGHPKRITRQEWQAQRDAMCAEATRRRLAWTAAHCTPEERAAVEQKVADRFDQDWAKYCVRYPDEVQP